MLALFLKVCNFDDYTYSDHNQITQYEYIIFLCLVVNKHDIILINSDISDITPINPYITITAMELSPDIFMSELWS